MRKPAQLLQLGGLVAIVTAGGGCLLILPLDELSDEDQPKSATGMTPRPAAPTVMPECKRSMVAQPFADDQLLIAYCAGLRRDPDFRCSHDGADRISCIHDDPELNYWIDWETPKKGWLYSEAGEHLGWVYPNTTINSLRTHWVGYRDGLGGSCTTTQMGTSISICLIPLSAL